MRDGVENTLFPFNKSIQHLGIDIGDALAVAIRPHAHHLRGLHEQVTKVTVEMFFDGFYLLGILVGKERKRFCLTTLRR
jgi:hypothetical protein